MTKAEIRKPALVLGVDCANPLAVNQLVERWREDLLNADVIAGSAKLMAELDQLGAWRGERFAVSADLQRFFESLQSWFEQGKRIVIFASGDPLLFGLGASIVRKFGPGSARIEAGVSVVQATAAAMGLPWHDMSIISLHGRKDFLPLANALMKAGPICILTSGEPGPAAIAAFCQDRGHKNLEANIFENLGQADERIRRLPLEECASSGFGSCAVMMLIPNDVALWPGPGAGDLRLAGTCASSLPVRGCILELLRIRHTDVVWDIGAGSGAAAIEFAGLVRAGRVIAVERRWDRGMDIQLNRQAAGAANLDLKRAQAPQCLADLPEPDKIFIGGGISGEDGTWLLEVCLKRLRPGGRLALSCILLESFTKSRQFFKDQNVDCEIWQLTGATAKPLGSGEILAPERSVFLLATQKAL